MAEPSGTHRIGPRSGPLILNEAQQAACEALRGRLRAAEAGRLRDLLVLHQRHAEAAARGDRRVDAELAGLLAHTLSEALERYPRLDPERQEWLRVAIDYFVASDDASHDFAALGGLDDDANVVAAVLEHCGLHEQAKAIRTHLA